MRTSFAIVGVIIIVSIGFVIRRLRHRRSPLQRTASSPVAAATEELGVVDIAEIDPPQVATAPER